MQQATRLVNFHNNPKQSGHLISSFIDRELWLRKACDVLLKVTKLVSGLISVLFDTYSHRAKRESLYPSLNGTQGLQQVPK